MDEINRLKYELSNAVKNSKEYNDYLYYKNLLNQNPELKYLVNEIRSLNFEFYNSSNKDNSILEDDIIRHKYEYICSQEIANGYLRAEFNLCQMVQDICNTIIEDIEIDLDFFK